MVQQPEGRERRERAEERVAAILAFHRHLAVYLIVNAFIFLIWLIIALTSHGKAWWPWFLFPLGGWGIGIAFHAINTYGAGRGGARHERLVQREMEKENKRENGE